MTFRFIHDILIRLYPVSRQIFVILLLIIPIISAHAANPDITSVSPTNICEGETLTINGSGFTDSPDMDKVVLNGIEITTFQSKSNSAATVIVPSGAVTNGLESVDIEAYKGTTLHDTYTISMNIGPVPADPAGATDNDYCEGETITSISVNDPGAGYSVVWYASSSGSTLASGTISGSNGQVFTPSTDATDTYYAEIEHDASGCVSDNRVGVTITRNDAPTDPSGATDASYCVGDPIPVISVNDPGGGYTVVWYTTSVGSTLASGTTGGNNGEEFTADNPGTATYYAEVVNDGTTCVSLNRQGVSLTENTIPATPTISTTALAPYCSGTTITLEADVVASSYIWYRDGSPIGGATNQTYNASLAGDYTVKAVDGGCESPESAAFTIDSAPSTPTITTAASTPYCAGVTITLDAGAGGDSYKWSQDAVQIPGETGQTYDASVAGEYTVIAVSASGCESSPSSGFTIGMVPDPPNIDPSFDRCGDGNIDISATLAGSSTPAADYRIQFSDDGGTGIDQTENNAPFEWNNIPVTVGSPKTINLRTQNKNTDCASDWSAVSTVLTANPEPSIDTQPTDQTVCENDLATFEVTASGTSLAYQWQYDDGGGWQNVPTVVGDEYTGETTSSLTIDAIASFDNNDYRVEVTETSGNINCPVNSSTRTLSVNTPAEVTFDNVPNSVCVPDNTNFSINLQATIQNGTVNDGIWEALSGTGGFGGSAPGTEPLSTSGDPDTEYWPTFTDVANGSVTLRLSADNQGICASQIDSQQKTITFLQNSAPTITALKSSVCPENEIKLVGELSDGGTSGTWSRVDLVNGDNPGGFSPSTTLTDTVDYMPDGDDLANGSVTIRLTQVGGACGVPDPAEVTIDFYTSPVTGSVVGEDSVCSNETNVIYSISPSPPFGYQFNWIIPLDAGSQSVGGKSESIGISFSNDTVVHTLSVFAQDMNGCLGDTVEFDVKISPLPAVTFNPDKTNYTVQEDTAELIAVNSNTGIKVSGDSVKNLQFTGPGVLYNNSILKYYFDPGAAGANDPGETHHIVMTYTNPVTGCVSLPNVQDFKVTDPANPIVNLDQEYCLDGSPSSPIELGPEVDLPVTGISYFNYSQTYGYPPSYYGGDLIRVDTIYLNGFNGPGLVGDPLGNPVFDPAQAGGPGTKKISYRTSRQYGWRIREYDPCISTIQVCTLYDPFLGGCLIYTPQCVGGYTGDTLTYPGLPEYYPPQLSERAIEYVEVYPIPAIPSVVDVGDGLADNTFQYCITDDIQDIRILNPPDDSNYQWFEDDQTTPISVAAANDSIITADELGFNNGNKPHTPGTYEYYVLQERFGCEGSMQKVTINIYPTPGQPVVSAYQSEYCSVDNIQTISINNPLPDETYTWYDQNGAGDENNIILLDATSYKPDFSEVNIPLDTVYYLTTTKYESGQFEGCESDPLTINIKVYEPPQVTFTGLDNEYCIDHPNPVNLVGLPAGAGGVFSGDGVNDSGLGLAEYIVAEAAEAADTSGVVTSHEVKYLYTDENGCSDSTSQSVLINPLPEPDFNLTDGREFCHNDPAFDLFDDTESVTSLVSRTYTTQKLGPIGEAYEPRFVGPDLITYSVEDQNGCKNSISKSVTINALPTPDFGLSTQCNNEEIEFINQSSIESGSIAAWKWEFGDGDTSVVETPVHLYEQSKQYNVSLLAISDKGCEKSNTQLVSIGRLPGIDFDFIGECEGGLTEFDASVNDSEADIISWLWDFDDQGSLSNQPLSTSHLFNSQGAFNVKLSVETREGCVEEEEKRVLILPTLDLTQNYFENFEENTEGWIPEDIRPEVDPENQKWSWMINDPSMEFIAPEPENGANFWATTKFNGGYDVSEVSALNSPCFNLSAFEKPMISFDRYKYLEETRDGVTFQYSLDNGSTWYILGEEGQGVNWYDTRGIIGLTEVDEENRSNGWTGEQQTWLTSKFNLDLFNYDSIEVIRFRIVLGSDNAKNFTGFAFDNVFIGERNRTVLIEQFANRNVDDSREEEIFIDNLLSTDNELITIKYHTGYPDADIFSADNKADPGGRSIFYGVSKVPYSIVDGNISNTLPFSSGWGPVETSKRILERSDFDLFISTPPSEEGLLNIQASILSLREYTGSLKAFVAVIEDSVTADNGEWTTHIVRKLLPDVSGFRIDRDWEVNEEEVLTYAYDLKNLSNISNDNITLVFFIQDENTKEILQATSYRTTNPLDQVLGLENSPGTPGFAQIYPNPADGYFKLKFLHELRESYQWMIIDQRGVNLTDGVIPAGSSMAEFDSSRIPAGLNHLLLKNKKGEFYIFKLIILH